MCRERAMAHILLCAWSVCAPIFAACPLPAGTRGLPPKVFAWPAAGAQCRHTHSCTHRAPDQKAPFLQRAQGTGPLPLENTWLDPLARRHLAPEDAWLDKVGWNLLWCFCTLVRVRTKRARPPPLSIRCSSVYSSPSAACSIHDHVRARHTVHVAQGCT